LTADRVCIEPIDQLNTVGVTTELPSTVTSSPPCGTESTVMLTFGSVLFVNMVVEVTDVVVFVFLVLLVVGETATTRKSSISAVLCFGAVNVLAPPETVWFVSRSITSFFTGSASCRNPPAKS
jgi:hypothetical protein